MADEKKKSDEKKQSGNLFKILIVVLLILIVVGGSAFAAYFVITMKGNNAKQVNSSAANTNIVANEVSAKTYALDDFLVNLADTDGKSYLKVKIYIGYENKKMDKELEEKKPILRDAINVVLRSKKSTDITEKGVEDIKKQILTRINPMFENGKADNIYFYDILVQ